MLSSCAPVAVCPPGPVPLARAGHAPELDEEVRLFPATVAHELRTPLSAMDGLCALLQQSLAELPADPARQRAESYADRLRAGLRHADALVQALQALSQASAAALRPEPVDLSALAGELFDGFVTRHPDAAHALRVQPGLRAWGDRVLLRQLLDNLLGNAWKFSAGAPTVRIEFGRDSGGAFFVRDHGAGFDMAEAARLFQPFERLHPAERFAGTGLGLATVWRIAARHGGRVWAQSRPGAGATFFFTLGEAPGAGSP